MTAPQLESRVQQMLNDRYLRDPHVTVNILQYGSHQVTVEGSVTSPGVVQLHAQERGCPVQWLSPSGHLACG